MPLTEAEKYYTNGATTQNLHKQANLKYYKACRVQCKKRACAL